MKVESQFAIGISSVWLLKTLMFQTEFIETILFFFILAEIGALQLIDHYRLKAIQNHSRKQKQWMKSILLSAVNQELGYSKVFEAQLDSALDIVDHRRYRQNEIGLRTTLQNTKIQFPDVHEAENQILSLEDTVTYSLFGILFIPLLFALSHLFRFPNYSQIFLALILCLFGFIVIERAIFPWFQMEGWNELTTLLSATKLKVQELGIHSIREFPAYIQNPQRVTLGLPIEYQMRSVSEKFFALTFTTLLNVPPKLRQVLLEKILPNLQEIAESEDRYNNRLRGLRMRIKLLAIVGCATISLLAAIAYGITQEQGILFVGIEPTPHLEWMLVGLVLFGDYLLLRRWMDNKSLRLLLGILFLEFLMLFEIASIVFG